MISCPRTDEAKNTRISNGCKHQQKLKLQHWRTHTVSNAYTVSGWGEMVHNRHFPAPSISWHIENEPKVKREQQLIHILRKVSRLFSPNSLNWTAEKNEELNYFLMKPQNLCSFFLSPLSLVCTIVSHRIKVPQKQTIIDFILLNCTELLLVTRWHCVIFVAFDGFCDALISMVSCSATINSSKLRIRMQRQFCCCCCCCYCLPFILRRIRKICSNVVCLCFVNEQKRAAAFHRSFCLTQIIFSHTVNMDFNHGIDVLVFRCSNFKSNICGVFPMRCCGVQMKVVRLFAPSLSLSFHLFCSLAVLKFHELKTRLEKPHRKTTKRKEILYSPGGWENLNNNCPN